ncbi:DUF1573 domain-containing protein [Cryomorpha ignava]|nr:DUF1573 domain-containing protein [Cryomorpha ignava]
MSESLKNGLMVFIAALLVVNTVLLVKNGSSSYADPTSAKATFERAADNNSTALANKKAADVASIDPLKSASTKPSGPLTAMDFNESTYDFGNILQDSENTKVFTFTNTGKEPLIIENAKGSCGCTVPQYPKEPIAPGATGEIKVVYKPGKQKNKQNKTVTITANTEPASTILTIMADVEEVPA